MKTLYDILEEYRQCALPEYIVPFDEFNSALMRANYISLFGTVIYSPDEIQNKYYNGKPLKLTLKHFNRTEFIEFEGRVFSTPSKVVYLKITELWDGKYSDNRENLLFRNPDRKNIITSIKDSINNHPNKEYLLLDDGDIGIYICDEDQEQVRLSDMIYYNNPIDYVYFKDNLYTYADLLEYGSFS